MKIIPEAELDIVNAYSYYTDISQTLGNTFLSSLEDSFAIIESNPQITQQIYKDVRRKLIKKFPFGIFYKMDEEIVVLAVLHARKNPQTWKTRSSQ